MNQTCNFSSLPQFLTSAASGNFSINSTIEACPDICELAWGSGNPDLSGIGAFVSYIFQAGLTVVLGPFFVLLYDFVDRGKWKLSRDTHEAFVSIQDVFLDSDAGFTLPVAIAALVRLRMSTPLFEIDFLESLLTMQFLSILGTSLAVAVVKPRHGIKRMSGIILYCVVDFALYMGLVGYLHTSKTRWAELHVLAVACQTYGRILPGFDYFHSPFHTSASQLLAPLAGFKHAKDFFILFGFISAGLVGLVLLSLAFSIGSLVCTAQLAQKRDVMKTIAGSGFEDDEWGFGQIIAIFLWAPVFIQVFSFLLSYFSSHSEGHEEAESLGTRRAASTEKTTPVRGAKAIRIISWLAAIPAAIRRLIR